MTYQQIATRASTYAAIAAVALAVAGAAGQMKGVAGMLLGLAAAAVGVYILYRIIAVIGNAMTEGGNPMAGTILAVFGALLKVPLLLLANAAANRLGGAAPGCFLAGVILVYSSLVAWAAAPR